MDKAQKKKYIQLGIIICAFAATGIVLYNGMFKSTPAPEFAAELTPGLIPNAGQPGIPEAGTGSLLPYGDDINGLFGVLKKNNLRYGQVNYPRLNPNFEVGVQLGDFIKPLPEEETLNP